MTVQLCKYGGKFPFQYHFGKIDSKNETALKLKLSQGIFWGLNAF